MDSDALKARLHRLIRDTGTPADFTDEYDDALSSALERVNFDRGTSYASVASVSGSDEYLVRLQASIFMVRIRIAAAAESAEGGSLSVPDLSISETSGSTDWGTMLEDLNEEYASAIAATVGSSAGSEGGIQQAVMVRRDRGTGAIRDRRLAVPITYDISVSYTQAGTSLHLTWTAHRTRDFRCYEILYSTTDNPPDPDSSNTRKTSEYDNQILRKTLTLTPGVWYVRVDLMSVNDLRSEGTTLTITVS